MGKYLAKSKKESRKKEHQKSLESKLNPINKELAGYFKE